MLPSKNCCRTPNTDSIGNWTIALKTPIDQHESEAAHGTLQIHRTRTAIPLSFWIHSRTFPSQATSDAPTLWNLATGHICHSYFCLTSAGLCIQYWTRFLLLLPINLTMPFVALRIVNQMGESEHYNRRLVTLWISYQPAHSTPSHRITDWARSNIH